MVVSESDFVILSETWSCFYICKITLLEYMNLPGVPSQVLCCLQAYRQPESSDQFFMVMALGQWPWPDFMRLDFIWGIGWIGGDLFLDHLSETLFPEKT